MSATMSSIQDKSNDEIERLMPEGAARGPGAPTVYLPWLRRYWSLWLESDARNDAWIR